MTLQTYGWMDGQGGGDHNIPAFFFKKRGDKNLGRG